MNRLLEIIGHPFVFKRERTLSYEPRAQARVDHPAICKVFEVGEIAGHRYIAMQEINGVTLDRVAPSLSLE